MQGGSGGEAPRLRNAALARHRRHHHAHRIRHGDAVSVRARAPDRVPLARGARERRRRPSSAEMDRDSKSTELKALQGRIWEEGYASGELTGAVFDDVPRAFARWQAAGTRIAIYSSGSVLAQQWLFRRSSAGDLTPFISRYFDTGVGPKRDPGSYTRIASAVALPPARITFVSDVAAELDAAAAAGMQARHVASPRQRPAASARAPRQSRSFDEIPSASAERAATLVPRSLNAPRLPRWSSARCRRAPPWRDTRRRRATPVTASASYRRRTTGTSA